MGHIVYINVFIIRLIIESEKLLVLGSLVTVKSVMS